MDETAFQLRYAQAAAAAGIAHPPLVLWDDVQRLIDESSHEWLCELIGSVRQATIVSDGLQDLTLDTLTMNADGGFFLSGHGRLPLEIQTHIGTPWDGAGQPPRILHVPAQFALTLGCDNRGELMLVHVQGHRFGMAELWAVVGG